MNNTIYAIICMVALMGTTGVAQGPSWSLVSIPDTCSFRIPPTMELQKGAYRILSDAYRGQYFQANSATARNVIQQKGLNANDASARARYVRVIIETQTAKRGDYLSLGSSLSELQQSDIAELDSIAKKAFQREMDQATAAGLQPKLKSWNGTRIVSLNGVECFLTEYTRALGASPDVFVRLYRIMNNDKMHSVSVSYRLSERSLWESDLVTLLKTLQFVKR